MRKLLRIALLKALPFGKRYRCSCNGCAVPFGKCIATAAWLCI